MIREVLADRELAVELQVARDGEMALRYFEHLEADETSVGPALILLDLNVPRIDGIEVLQRLRMRSRWKDVPVIVVTSSKTLTDRTLAAKTGADAFFQKPSELAEYTELVALVRKVLKIGNVQ